MQNVPPADMQLVRSNAEASSRAVSVENRFLNVKISASEMRHRGRTLSRVITIGNYAMHRWFSRGAEAPKQTQRTAT